MSRVVETCNFTSGQHNRLSHLAKQKPIGLIDADLLCNGTRHPNLVLLKLAGFFKSKGYAYRLITDMDTNLNNFSFVYLSRVFTFTTLPEFVNRFQKEHHADWGTYLKMGGTGFYAAIEDHEEFVKARNEDMTKLERDELLHGFSMIHQMPDYDLYVDFVNAQLEHKTKQVVETYKRDFNVAPDQETIEKCRAKFRKQYKDYLDYSIGFLTRGCIRQCPFCVNRNEKKVAPYSSLEDFVDNSRPYIYLWDDNFLSYPHWQELLQALIDTGKPFQFRQGLDERVLDEARCKMLAKARYHGDFIFAFDRWEDRFIVERKLKLWRKFNPTKTTKFYLFCGYELTPGGDKKLFDDVLILFKRIEILMTYGCLGYVMRHEDCHNHALGNIYTQIARWCNQPQFYKKMSFYEYVMRNQSYQEEHSGSTRICKALKTYNEFRDKFSKQWDTIEPLFKMKFEQKIDVTKWK